MTRLIDQPTKLPTRKLLAVVIAGAVTGIAQSLLATFLPDFAAGALVDQLGIWVQTGVMVAAGYLTRERAE